ncbi:MAG: transcriptional repressor [Deferribacteraceae bacterium]|jgi:Fe2+ or Zn2+ uptake regulation protein|nr:transcriptional repressor [Deferribacteraceae bacterium]
MRLDGKRNTVQRKIIFDSLSELDCHATAEQVYAAVVRKHPSISKATVYRNIAQMVEAGELLNIGNFYGAAHYDHHCQKHYHFICEECKLVYDVNVDFPDLSAQLVGMDRFEITGHTLTFSGICPTCKEVTK